MQMLGGRYPWRDRILPQRLKVLLNWYIVNVHFNTSSWWWPPLHLHLSQSGQHLLALEGGQTRAFIHHEIRCSLKIHGGLEATGRG